ncbi:MAG TPA: PepSY-associated TM helix domain-containing protein [Gammaproteobacteria bacterium]|nr:PepSY-associated TM helix domain-containing protein [Gammaproteobacteria bacterium]
MPESNQNNVGPPERAQLSGWRRWAVAPQSLRWRRWLMRIHSWTGLGLGLYVVLLSITGSASVLRPQFHLWMVPRTVPIVGTRLKADELREALRQSYDGYEISAVSEGRRPDSPVRVTLQRDGVETERLFDPYAARDIGLMYPPVLNVVEWVVDLHDNLLGGETGRTVNGVGATLFFLLAVSGALLWWPGKVRWTENLMTGWPEKTRRFTQRVHVAFGFWSLPIVLLWGLTAIYFAFPDPFIWLIDPSDPTNPADIALRALVNWHFGRFGGMTSRVIWVVIGLIPGVLFVTGFIMWRLRALRRQRAAAIQAQGAGAGAPAFAAAESRVEM